MPEIPEIGSAEAVGFARALVLGQIREDKLLSIAQSKADQAYAGLLEHHTSARAIEQPRTTGLELVLGEPVESNSQSDADRAADLQSSLTAFAVVTALLIDADRRTRDHKTLAGQIVEANLDSFIQAAAEDAGYTPPLPPQYTR